MLRSPIRVSDHVFADRDHGPYFYLRASRGDLLDVPMVGRVPGDR